MNDTAMAQAVQRKARPRFYGNSTLRPKAAMHFPGNLAEEYAKTARQYMALLESALKAHLPAIRRAIDAERAGLRADASRGVPRMIREAMGRARQEFGEKAAAFGIERRIATLAAQARRRSVSEWKRVVRRTLGVNILEDYYSGEFHREAIRQWTRDNASLITTLAGESLTRMENIIQGGYLRGAGNSEMSRLIQEAYGVDRKHAQFIARDQTAKLNGEITQAQQRDAGVSEYVWDSSGDGRVRACHKGLDGKTFSWDDPPEMWYETKKGRVHTGRRCHPGEDYQCRCVALPVFDIETLNLPWEGGG